MRHRGMRVAPLGEVVAAYFDEAKRFSKDPAVVNRLATRAVIRLLLRGRSLSRSLRPLRRDSSSRP
jgi:hypothetical protein